MKTATRLVLLFFNLIPLYAVDNIFDKSNLAAWCIVPFDGKQRTPEERAEMLARLGIRHFAYDWRQEHIASFEDEIVALKKHGIELSAFNSSNESAFQLFEKYDLKPQVWATFRAAPASVTDYKERVEFAIQSVLPLVERTRRMGCQLGLYAHGGWSGHPDNMVAVARRLREEHGASHVGIVYNLHWAHNVLDRFPEIMAMLKPYLIGMNINGMTRNGPALGKMILPLGQGDLDITLLRQIRDSGYTGRIGILNHTNEDAELRLQDNLDGLAWIVPQLDGSPAGPKPKPRSWMEPTQVSAQMFGRANLAAWCIVPYDGKRRGPEERAAMLQRLGITKFVYDYRKEHILQWDAELAALTKHHIDLLGWWFPNQLNDEAKAALELFKRHGVRPQLWVSGGGGPIAVKDAADQKARVAAEVTRLKPVCAAASEIRCTVGLYNHGNWFGEPENQLAIIEALKADGVTNVGIVYNFHHGHSHLDRVVRILARTLPHLLCVNLNGMDIGGDEKGRKILPLGAGTEDLRILHMLRESGYRGPIGILNHTSEDAEARLLDNLDGLNWLLPQLDRKDPGPKPAYRTKIGLAP